MIFKFAKYLVPAAACLIAGNIYAENIMKVSIINTSGIKVGAETKLAEDIISPGDISQAYDSQRTVNITVNGSHPIWRFDLTKSFNAHWTIECSPHQCKILQDSKVDKDLNVAVAQGVAQITVTKK